MHPTSRLAARSLLAGLASIALVGAVLSLSAAPAAGGLGGGQTITYECADGAQSFFVPDGVYELTIEMSGGGGGAGDGTPAPENLAPGGAGGSITAVVPVEPIDEVEVRAGCVGLDANREFGTPGAGGFGFAGGGGVGGDASNPGGGGGGASGVSLEGAIVLMAGAGGGGGGDIALSAVGGDGGAANEPGADGGEAIAGCAGEGGTLTDPGAGGVGATLSGSAGSFSFGGAGAGTGADTGGGGGGGGYRGGGGGGAEGNSVCGGGGGGSSFAAAEVEVLESAGGANEGDGIVEITLAGPSFVDVSEDHPFYDEIQWMAATEISTGFPDGTYRPSAPVSRQAMSAFMFRLAGEPAFSLPAEPSFPDVSESHPFYDEIEWMAFAEISTGFPDGTYRPGVAVSRQAMSAFMFRLAGEPAFSLPAEPSFPDVSESHPFYEDIEWMAFEEVAGGYDDDTFRPSNPVSRQAMAAFMRRFPIDT